VAVALPIAGAVEGREERLMLQRQAQVVLEVAGLEPQMEQRLQMARLILVAVVAVVVILAALMEQVALVAQVLSYSN